MFIETLESRQLMAADVSLSTTRVLFSGVKNKTTATQTITITNHGDSTLKISSGGVSISGTDYNRFALSSPPTLPKSILPGGSLSLQVVFKPTVAGVKAASLKIKSNDPDSPTVQVALRGLGTNGLYDSMEPSLQRIFNLFQLNIKCGDRDFTTNRIDGLDPNDSVQLSTLAKAGDGPVTFEMLAAYTGASNPGGKFGWYSPADAASLNELFTLPSTDVQKINPATSGAMSFDPGDAEFALYSNWPTQKHPNVFSEAKLNTWESSEVAQQKYHYYPLKKIDGTIIDSAYVVAVEEATNNDYQDAVMILRNVKQYVAPIVPTPDPTPDPLPPTPPVDPQIPVGPVVDPVIASTTIDNKTLLTMTSDILT